MAGTLNLICKLALAALLFSSCRNYPQLRLPAGTEKTAYPCSFIIPRKDKANGIEALFVKTDTTGGSIRKEVTLVFKDEDQPFFLFDWIYDAYRGRKYSRKKDTETFLVYYAAGTGRFDSIAFPGTYSREQHFRKGFVAHFDTAFSAAAFAGTDRIPLVYINTWNHLFSPADHNRALPKDTVTAGLLLTGSRAEAENQLRRKRTGKK